MAAPLPEPILTTLIAFTRTRLLDIKRTKRKIACILAECGMPVGERLEALLETMQPLRPGWTQRIRSARDALAEHYPTWVEQWGDDTAQRLARHEIVLLAQENWGKGKLKCPPTWNPEQHEDAFAAFLAVFAAAAKTRALMTQGELNALAKAHFPRAPVTLRAWPEVRGLLGHGPSEAAHILLAACLGVSPRSLAERRARQHTVEDAMLCRLLGVDALPTEKDIPDLPEDLLAEIRRRFTDLLPD